MSVVAEPERIPTGIPGLDEILLGGLTVGQTYLIEGQPGTGKTTASLQFLLEGKRRGERCLFISLSESKADLELAARSHGWSLEGVSILEFVPQEASLEDAEQYSVFHPGEVELAGTIKKLVAEVERINPQRLVIDSLVEFRLLAREPVHYRRQVLALKHFFSGRHITVLMLDDPASATSSDLQVESMVHGVIRISVLQRSYGSRRRHAEVIKVRSSAFREGFHDYTIRRGGIEIYPRLVAAEHGDDFPPQQVSSGLSALDAMFGGGIERGSSTLILGPSGVGKSSLTMLYAHAAAERAERTVVYTFDETLRTSRLRARGLGIAVNAGANQHLCMEQVDPAELSPGEFIARIRREVEQNQTRVIVIDSLNGFKHSMPGEHDLVLQLHELLTFLNQKGIVTFITLTQPGLIGGSSSDEFAISYLADSVLLVRYFESEATVRRAISVFKKRSGAHENTIRELRFGSHGIEIGEPLTNLRGIMSGIPDSIRQRELGSEGIENGRER